MTATTEVTTQSVTKDPALLLLLAGRAQAAVTYPYLQAALFAMKPVRSTSLPTLAVDKRWRMYWNPDFILTLDLDEVVGCWLHEVWHLMREHGARFAALHEPDYNHPKWNCAADAAINEDLRAAKIKVPSFKMWFPERIPGAKAGMTSEQMYRLYMDSLPDWKKYEGKPTLALLPSRVRYDDPTPVEFVAVPRNVSKPKGTKTPTVTIVGADGTNYSSAISNRQVNSRQQIAFDLGQMPTEGNCEVEVTYDDVTLTGGFTVWYPKMRVSPDHLVQGYAAPVRMTIDGNGTRFGVGTTVELLDDHGVAAPIGNIQVHSDKSINFEVPTVADGMYTVKATTASGEVTETPLSIGLPFIELSPDSLPHGFTPSVLMKVLGDDIVFDQDVKINLMMPTPAGWLPIDDPFSNVQVHAAGDMTVTLDVALSDGTYKVIVEASDGATALADLNVGGEGETVGGGGGEGDSDDDADKDGKGGKGGKGGNSGNPEGEGEGDDEGEGEAEPECGSGAGGAARDYEVPESQNDDGSVSEGRGSLIRDEVAKRIVEHAKSRGNTPGNWTRWAENRLTPQVDWRRQFRNITKRVTSAIAGRVDYSYRRISRRASAMPGVALPGMQGPRPPICDIVVDTSGSMSDNMLSQCLAEMTGIIREVTKGGQKVRVLAVDASAAEVQKVSNANKVVLSGGGGTDMRVGIAAAAALRPKADMIVTLTDGETPWPTEPDPANPRATYVAVLVNGEASYSQVPPWMKKIVLTPDYSKKR